MKEVYRDHPMTTLSHRCLGDTNWSFTGSERAQVLSRSGYDSGKSPLIEDKAPLSTADQAARAPEHLFVAGNVPTFVFPEDMTKVPLSTDDPAAGELEHSFIAGNVRQIPNLCYLFNVFRQVANYTTARIDLKRPSMFLAAKHFYCKLLASVLPPYQTNLTPPAARGPKHIFHDPKRVLRLGPRQLHKIPQCAGRAPRARTYEHGRCSGFHVGDERYVHDTQEQSSLSRTVPLPLASTKDLAILHVVSRVPTSAPRSLLRLGIHTGLSPSLLARRSSDGTTPLSLPARTKPNAFHGPEFVSCAARNTLAFRARNSLYRPIPPIPVLHCARFGVRT
ncbi:hypothetical protein B0H11DRAFT_1931264 [Mycena galericulata]|nr:hypothetical protein B0H11DRAFT_1931264 [Mycena galericulata]